MIFLVIILFISLILEGFVSNFVSIDTNLWNNCFTIISLIIIYPYLYHRVEKYYFLAFILGLLVDIIYTNTLFLNAFIYVIVAFIIGKINILIPSNFFNNWFVAVIVITIYRIITYLILNIIGYLYFDLNVLIHSITSSIFLNIIYIMFLYVISDFVSRKLRINKID